MAVAREATDVPLYAQTNGRIYKTREHLYAELRGTRDAKLLEPFERRAIQIPYRVSEPLFP